MVLVGKSLELLKAQAHICSQIFNFKNSASLKCAVELGIPDAIHKHGKPMTLSELTAALPINPTKAPGIYRLMRILVKAGFFLVEKSGEDEESIEGYALTSTGHLLLEKEPLNGRAMILMVLDPVMVRPWFALSEWFQNDDPTPFVTANGKNLWDYNAEEPRLGKLFNEAMASDSQLVTKVIVEDCKFVFEGLTSLVDVGGGTGTVARALSQTFPGLKCLVYDLPHVVAGLRGIENVDFVAGDMLDNIPPADAVLLKFILHNFNDEDCVKILNNCKRSIPTKEKGGKVIIIDMAMESSEQTDANSVEAQTSLDMQMLVIHNAKERTEKEWAKLIKNAGFGGYKVFPLLCLSYLIEIYP